ncbi:hypothetical protein ACFVQ4_27450 [Streptomyces laurentii]|uniref:hypothetical protein n=2 Tax=Streptomyces laurentii TaxID=39478 RepID=UPI0036AC071A
MAGEPASVRGRGADAPWKGGTPKTPSRMPATAAIAETTAAISPNRRTGVPACPGSSAT